MGGAKMLRTLIISAFLPNMMTANQRDPYMYPIRPPPTVYTEIPLAEPQANYLPNHQYPHKFYTFTDKPLNRPIIIEPDTRPEQKTYNEIPGFNAKPFVNNENTVTDSSYSADDYATAIPLHDKPSYDFNLPIYPEKPDNKPAYFLPDNRPMQHYELQPSKLTEKPTNKETIQAFPHYQTPDQLYDLPNNEEPVNQIVLPHNRPELYESKIPVLTEKPVNNAIINQALTYDQPEQFYDYQIPAYTEKLVNKLTLSNDRDPYKPNLPVLTEIPVYNTEKFGKDNLIKKKLVSLILSSKKDLERHIRDIERIHDSYKSGTMYKIGYLTSLINKANESLSKLYKNVQNNHQKWDSLRVLDTYEEVKAESELIQDMLQVMLSFMKAKHKNLEEDVALKGPGQRAVRPSISWSYYDDTMP